MKTKKIGGLPTVAACLVPAEPEKVGFNCQSCGEHNIKAVDQLKQELIGARNKINWLEDENARWEKLALTHEAKAEELNEELLEAFQLVKEGRKIGYLKFDEFRKFLREAINKARGVN